MCYNIAVGIVIRLLDMVFFLTWRIRMTENNWKDKTVTMYRPCGQAELDLVVESGFKKWPPRLPEQPIFYPVTNEAYAREVNKWNVSQFGKGYITMFKVKEAFASRYETQMVGGSNHTEWWIPAEDLEELNRNIVGLIEIIGQEPAK